MYDIAALLPLFRSINLRIDVAGTDLTNIKIPETLRQRLSSGKVIPFVGAGVSMSVLERDGGKPLFPSWRELLERAALRLEDENDAEHAALVRNFLSPKTLDYLEAARYARRGMGPVIWFEFLSEQFDKSPESASPQSLEVARAVWGLGSRLVITTNFDSVLHWASPQQGGPASWDIEAPAALAALLQGNLPRPTVWHLHGQIHNASKLILTPDGYSLLYHEASEGEAEKKYEAALQTLRALLVSHTLLFVGFSLDDVFFRRQLERVNQIYEGGAGPHYILMREADVSRSQHVENSVKVVTFPAFGAPLVNLLKEMGAVAAGKESAGESPEPKYEEIERKPAVADYDPRHPPFFVPFRQKGAQVLGREDALQAVRKQLTSGRRTAIGQTASFQGLGGLGKTQLAVEYAYRFRDAYPNGVIWLNADQDIDAQLTDLAEKARWASPYSEHKYKLETAIRRLRTYSDCLIIFDNLEDPQAIQEYLPEPQADPHILVTSRNPQPGFTPIPLDPLDEALSIELLFQEAGRKPEGDAEETAAREIARTLGGLPLALELAGAYLQYRPISFRQYLELLQQNLKAATALKFSTVSFTRHETDLYSTLKINEEVFEEEPRLRDILDLLTWSGTAPMGLSLMSHLLGAEPLELASALGLGTLLRMLQRSPDADSYSIHRLLAEVRREEISLEGRTDWANGICQRIGDWFQERRREFTNLPELEAEIDHLKAWQEHARKYVPDKVSRLIWLEAYPPNYRGRFREAKELVESALQLFEQRQEKDEELRAHLLNDLGTCYLDFLNYQTALTYFERALTIRQKNFSDNHNDTADTLSNLGVTYRRLGNYEKALEFGAQALSIRSELFGEFNPDTSRSLLNVSTAYASMGKNEQALEYAERSLKVHLKLHGEEHPSTAFSLRNIGTIYTDLNQARRALEYSQKALTISVSTLGNHHPKTIEVAINVAITLSNMGRALQAYKLLDELLRTVPNDNPRYDMLKQEHLTIKNRVPGLRHGARKKKRRGK